MEADLSYTLARSVDMEITRIYCHAPNYFFVSSLSTHLGMHGTDDDDGDEYNHDVFYPRAMVR